MKQEINAALILLAFPILILGGSTGNRILSSIGIGIMLVTACLIVLKKKAGGTKRTAK